MKKSSLSSLVALAALTSASLHPGVYTSPLSTPYKPPRPQPRMVTAPRTEIEAWNRAVDERKAAKKRGRK